MGLLRDAPDEDYPPPDFELGKRADANMLWMETLIDRSDQ